MIATLTSRAAQTDDLHQWVSSVTDADVILREDGAALEAALFAADQGLEQGDMQSACRSLGQFTGTVGRLLDNGDLEPSEAEAVLMAAGQVAHLWNCPNA